MKKSIIPYIIVAVFVAFGTFIISIVVQSMQHDVNLVTKDYYAQELAYETQIQKESRSNQYKDQVNISHLKNEQMMRIQLPKELQKLQGNLLLYRPSSSKMDVSVPLQMNQHNEQYIATEKLAKGVWVVKVYVNANNENYYFEKEILI